MISLMFSIAHSAEPCGPGGCPAPTDVSDDDTTDLIRPASHLRTATFALG